MTNLYKILLALSVIGLFLFWFWHKAENSGVKTETIKQQEQQIEEKNVIIKTNREIQQRKAIAKAVDPNTNLDWLRTYRCKDCTS